MNDTVLYKVEDVSGVVEGGEGENTQCFEVIS